MGPLRGDFMACPQEGLIKQAGAGEVARGAGAGQNCFSLCLRQTSLCKVSFLEGQRQRHLGVQGLQPRETLAARASVHVGVREMSSGRRWAGEHGLLDCHRLT